MMENNMNNVENFSIEENGDQIIATVIGVVIGSVAVGTAKCIGRGLTKLIKKGSKKTKEVFEDCEEEVFEDDAE